MTADIQITVRRLVGPSVEADDTVTIVGIHGLGGGEWAEDAAWRASWRTLCASLGLSVADAGGAAEAAAAATEGLAAWASGRPPVPVRPARTAGEFVLPDMDRAVARAAARLGVATVDLSRAGAARPDAQDSIRQHADRLRALAEALPGEPNRPMALVLTEALDRLGVPWHWSTAYLGLAAVGEGRRQTLFDGLKSLREPLLGGMLGGNKLAIKRYLSSFGVPVLPDRVVTDAEAAGPAAASLGFPVAIKPIDGSLGRGLSLDIRTPEEAQAACERARPQASAVMIEPYLDLPDFRAVVIKGEVMMTFRRNPPWIVGDGRSTVAALMAEHNRRVAENRAAFPAKHPIADDEDLARTLTRQGLGPGSVLEAGRRVVLHTSPLLHSGGYAEEVTDRLHAATRALFRRLATLVQLTVTAIDFRAEAVERPWDTQRFAILEFNSRPNLGDFRGHPMIDAIVRLAAPDADSVRLPTLLVVDPDPDEGPARLRARIEAAELPYGVRGPDGLRLGGLAVGIAAGEAHRRMTEDPTLAVAIHWATPESLCRDGIGAATLDLAWMPSEGAVPDPLDALVRRLARRIERHPEGGADGLVAAVLAAAERLAAAPASAAP
ncbi:hypothetical protein [Stella sp.]|uniref:ATP-binding protein n=1 Tax=Stella sp. TaxID=2912054 RepID=UPI0035B1B344